MIRISQVIIFSARNRLITLTPLDFSSLCSSSPPVISNGGGGKAAGVGGGGGGEGRINSRMDIYPKASSAGGT